VTRPEVTAAVVGLAARARAGDLAAFGLLAEKYRGMVLAAVRRHARSREDAEDLAQEALLRALRFVGGLRDPASFPSWLWRVAVQTALARPAPRPGPPPAAEPAAPGACPLEALLRAELRQIVRRAVAGLRPTDREVLGSYYLAGRSVGETARLLGVPRGTVQSRLHAARRRARAALSALGGDPCAAS